MSISQPIHIQITSNKLRNLSDSYMLLIGLYYIYIATLINFNSQYTVFKLYLNNVLDFDCKLHSKLLQSAYDSYY